MEGYFACRQYGVRCLGVPSSLGWQNGPGKVRNISIRSCYLIFCKCTGSQLKWSTSVVRIEFNLTAVMGRTYTYRNFHVMLGRDLLCREDVIYSWYLYISRIWLVALNEHEKGQSGRRIRDGTRILKLTKKKHSKTITLTSFHSFTTTTYPFTPRSSFIFFLLFFPTRCQSIRLLRDPHPLRVVYQSERFWRSLWPSSLLSFTFWMDIWSLSI